MRARPSVSVEALWRTALTLARSARRRESAGRLPPLLFFTDPVRTPDPAALAEQLPTGAGVVFRHFGREDAGTVGAALAEVARRRRLTLLIGDDEDLAARLGAHGVHLPERRSVNAKQLRARRPAWIITVAAHSARALACAHRASADAAVLSSIFPSRSVSAGRPWGVVKTALLVRGARLPVYGLGGVDGESALRLARTGLIGIASVSGLDKS